MNNERKYILSKLAGNVEIIERQDSLQTIAAMPEGERKSLIKKLVRQLRKQQGLKDEGVVTAAKSFSSKQEQPATSLFADNSKKGDWYFYNKNSRQNGLKDFEAKWGKRINVDDWRRSTSLSAGKRPSAGDDQTSSQNVTDPAAAFEDAEITFDALNEKLPLTPEKLQQSIDSVQTAQFDLGILYIQQLEDCKAATETLEDLRKRFPQHPKMVDVLFNLYYCYNKHGETARAD